MVQVLCGPLEHRFLRPLHALAWSAGAYRFVAAAQQPGIVLEVVERALPAPWVAKAGGRVLLTEKLVETFAAYARVPIFKYLQLVAVCGVAQGRTLACNPLLRPEDFLHADPGHCIFARRYLLDDFFSAIESPTLCQGCRTFYRPLLPEAEFGTLHGVVEGFARSALEAPLRSH